MAAASLITIFLSFPFSLCLSGPSFSGYDDTTGDNSTANAADSPAAGPEPSAAPGSASAAAGPHVAAGE